MVDFISELDKRIDDAIAAFEEDLYTAMPGYVESYDETKQEAVVFPSISVYERDFSVTEFRAIKNVPVVFPVTAEGGLTLPVKKGTSGLIVWAQRSIDSWQAQSRISSVNPESFRKHNLTDAFFIPGAWPSKLNTVKKRTLSGDSSADIILSHNLGTSKECHVNLKSTGDIEITNKSNSKIVIGIDGGVEITSTENLDITVAGNTTLGVTGNVSATVGGTLTATSTGAASLTAPTTSITSNTTVTGTLTVTGLITGSAGLAVSGGSGATITGDINVSSGDITVTGGDVIASNVSLKDHTHDENGDGGGTTDPPNTI